ncbi:MAG: hypothetical protein U0R52_11780 [Solirubrobacterales bacterium]
MREFELTIGLAEAGRRAVAEGNAELVITALEADEVELEPVVDADFTSGVLHLTICVGAEDADRALQRGRPLLDAAIGRAGLTGAEVVRIEVRPAGLDRAELVRA